MSQAPVEKPKRDFAKDFRLVVMTLAAVLLVWFVVGNSETVNVHFWVVSAQASLIVVILISAALGAIISLLLARSRRKNKKK
jgi:uncharacterized integral membrane protein